MTESSGKIWFGMGVLLLIFSMILVLAGCGYLEQRHHDGPLFLVSKKGKLGWIDKEGKIIIKPQFYYAGDFHEGMAVVRIAGGYGYASMADTDGLIDLPFEDAKPFLNGRAYVKKDGKWGVVNKTLELVQPYTLSEPKSEIPPPKKDRNQYGLEKLRQNGRMGFKGAADRIVVACRYDWLDDFVDGLAKFGQGEFEGYVDTKGREVWRYEK